MSGRVPEPRPRVEINVPETHVDAASGLSRDGGSIPPGSIHARVGCGGRRRITARHDSWAP